MKVAFYLLFAVVSLSPAWGQIAQSRPEYCGISGGINPPLEDVSATIDQRNDRAMLYLGHGNASTAVALDGSPVFEIAEICPLPGGRLAVFGDMGGAIAVYIVDRAKATVTDSFWAYHPVISPNQRWVAYVKFYPLHGVEGSNQYMIYDLTKSPTENRPANETKDMIDVGKVIFPPGHENFPGSNTQLTAEQRHLGGTRIYWAADSRAILFEDRDESGPGIVLVTLDEKGAPTALKHKLTGSEICGLDNAGGGPLNWRLERAEIGRELAGSRTIVVDVGSWGDIRCAPHVLHLRREEFKPARVETNVKPAYPRGAVLDDREVTPPRKKK